MKKQDKVQSYIKRRLKNDTYKVGEQIDSITSIAKDNNVCFITARNAVEGLIKKGLISKEDDKFFAIGRPGIRLSTAEKTLDLLKQTEISLRAAELLEHGIYDSKLAAVISLENNVVTVLYVLKAEEDSFNLDLMKKRIVYGAVKPNHPYYTEFNVVNKHIPLFTRNMYKLKIKL